MRDDIDWRGVLHSERDAEIMYYKATPRTRTATAIARVCGISVPDLLSLNPGISFPVAIGAEVRID